MRCIGSCCLLLGVLVAAADGESDIHPAFKYAWGENIGWTNWRDANNADDGVAVEDTFLAGYIWAENVGWIHVGDGSPAGGTYYANADNTDYGVNIDVNGNLYGLAWGENIGWINFDTRTALGPYNQQARLDDSANRFRGYAWAENVGWLNLDDADHFVARCSSCTGDLNDDGYRNVTDFTRFANAYGSQIGDARYDPCADLNGNGFVNATDFTQFAAVYGVACP